MDPTEVIQRSDHRRRNGASVGTQPRGEPIEVLLIVCNAWVSHRSPVTVALNDPKLKQQTTMSEPTRICSHQPKPHRLRRVLRCPPFLGSNRLSRNPRKRNHCARLRVPAGHRVDLALGRQRPKSPKSALYPAPTLCPPGPQRAKNQAMKLSTR